MALIAHRLDRDPLPFLAEIVKSGVCTPKTPEKCSSLIMTPTKRQRVRRLDLDAESPLAKAVSSSSLSVCRVGESEFVRFPRKPKSDPQAVKEESCESTFCMLRSSPMQVFNSFARTVPYLAQTVCQFGPGDHCSNSKGRDGTHKACCNCKKSRCLKLYCECFFNKTYCRGCKCENCLNTEENEDERNRAMQATLVRNPVAFAPKILRQVTSPKHLSLVD